MVSRFFVVPTLALWLLFCIGVFHPGQVLAKGDAPVSRPAILLVAFGSSEPEARDSLHGIEAQVRKAFPGSEVRWAYTSDMLRKKLAADGVVLPDVEQALNALREEGFSRVVVQSLHVIPGQEFHKLLHSVEARRGEFAGLVLGRPLMNGTEDLERLAATLPACLPPERKPDEAVLFMGHGTHHAADVYYPALYYYLSRSNPDMLVATVEGSPTLDDALKVLQEKKHKKVWLAPLMTVAGDHAHNDMAGSDKDSWVNVLARAGITGVLYGLGIGPGDPELLTLKAVRVLGAVDVVFAAASSKNDYSLSLRIAAPHLRPEAVIERLDFPMTSDRSTLLQAWERNAARVAETLDSGRDAAFLTLGDPMTYSTFIYLLRTLEARGDAPRVEVVPGITSYHAAAARTRTPLAEAGQSLAVISGAAGPERLKALLAVADNAVVLKAYRNFGPLRQALDELELGDKAVFVSRLGMEDECVVFGLEHAPDAPHYLSLVLVRKTAG